MDTPKNRIHGLDTHLRVPEGALRIVVLDCPYDILAQPLAQPLFSRFVAAKLESFRGEYPYGVLPLGVHDFIATLIMVGEGGDEDFEPLGVFKSISLERCERFRVPFEFLTLLEGEHRAPHREAAHTLIQDARGRSGGVFYASSWSMRPVVRQDTVLRRAVRNLMLTALCFHYLESGFSKLTAIANPRLKTDDLLEGMGFQELMLKGQPLPPLTCDFTFGQESVALHASSFRADFIERVHPFKHVWDARRVISAKGDSRGALPLNPSPKPPPPSSRAGETGLEPVSPG
jgi:hypothetical protein